jgi:hypothetical protein
VLTALAKVFIIHVINTNLRRCSVQGVLQLLLPVAALFLGAQQQAWPHSAATSLALALAQLRYHCIVCLALRLLKYCRAALLALLQQLCFEPGGR